MKPSEIVKLRGVDARNEIRKLMNAGQVNTVHRIESAGQARTIVLNACTSRVRSLKKNITAKCPKCGTNARGRASVARVFGYRTVGGREVRQSYCRSCRGKS